MATDALADLIGAVTMVDGGFDPLHEGHVEYFRAAAELGLPVFVNVTGDHYVARKHPVLLSARRRAVLIDALADVDYVHVAEGSTAEVLEALRPRRYVKGVDWKGRLPDEEIDVCDRHGIEIVFLDTVVSSSTELIVDVLHRDTGAELARLEAFIAAQIANPPSNFDRPYFVDSWRGDGNAYTIDARRAIEGRNPELIKDVLQPSTLLDAGCGPGVLMALLQEQGVVAHGLDPSEEVLRLAPADVAERISIGSVLRMPFAGHAYDVVVCREVLEHLTVPEVTRAVSELCRVAARLVYVTTRFHPAPTSLFDVATELDVDPTHITCLNKDLLRTLFVLNGFRRRADLEDRMDWLEKRRVLVYERGA